MELSAIVSDIKTTHFAVEGMCNECVLHHPCNEYRLADDWMRMRSDLTRAFRNRTGAELYALRKYACAMCSKKETGLICVDCIEEAGEDTSDDTI